MGKVGVVTDNVQSEATIELDRTRRMAIEALGGVGENGAPIERKLIDDDVEIDFNMDNHTHFMGYQLGHKKRVLPDGPNLRVRVGVENVVLNDISTSGIAELITPYDDVHVTQLDAVHLFMRWEDGNASGVNTVAVRNYPRVLSAMREVMGRVD